MPTTAQIVNIGLAIITVAAMLGMIFAALSYRVGNISKTALRRRGALSFLLVAATATYPSWQPPVANFIEGSPYGVLAVLSVAVVLAISVFVVIHGRAERYDI